MKLSTTNYNLNYFYYSFIILISLYYAFLTNPSTIYTLYLQSLKSNISLSTYIKHLDFLQKNQKFSKDFTIQNIPYILIGIQNYESDKKLKKQANVLFEWCKKFNNKK
jgi:hypothetical protein